MAEDKLKVYFDNPQDGWMTFSIHTPENELRFFVSYTPYDLMSELVAALLNVIDGYDAKAHFADIPEQYELDFAIAGNKARLQIHYYKDIRRIKGEYQTVLTLEETRTNLCLAFWRAIRNLQGRVSATEYEQNFRHTFPERETKILGEKLKRLKSGTAN